MNAYEPHPGSLAARAIEAIDALAAGEFIANASLAKLLGATSGAVSMTLVTAERHGRVERLTLDNGARVAWRRAPPLVAQSWMPSLEGARIEEPAAEREVAPAPGDSSLGWVAPPAPAQSIDDELVELLQVALDKQDVAAGAAAAVDEPDSSPPALQNGKADTPEPGQREAAPQADGAAHAEPLTWDNSTAVERARHAMGLSPEEPPAAPAPRVHESAMVFALGDVHVTGAVPARRPRAARAPRAKTAHPCDSSTSAARATRFALWSDGELVIARPGEKPIELSPAETRDLVHYLERMAEVAE